MTGSGTPSIRRALVAGMLTMALVPALLVGALGVHNLNRSVRDEAQARVNRILGIAMAAYMDEVDRLRSSLETAADRVAAAEGPPEGVLPALRRELDLDVLGLADAAGRPLHARERANRRLPLRARPMGPLARGGAQRSPGGWRHRCGIASAASRELSTAAGS